jgi:endonuclease III
MKEAQAESRQPDPALVQDVFSVLRQTYPDADCALDHRNPYELLVATVLSAQCTDRRVNQVTPRLFTVYPNPHALAQADPVELEELIRTTGFFRTKARNLTAAAAVLVKEFGGAVPPALEDLLSLPGVGRKTANVILGNAFGIPGMVVDTHVKRVAYRLGWTRSTDPKKIEGELCRLIPEEQWTQTGHLLIHHGRAICKAPVPICSVCPVLRFCSRTGVKKSR